MKAGWAKGSSSSTTGGKQEDEGEKARSFNAKSRKSERHRVGVK